MQKSLIIGFLFVGLCFAACAKSHSENQSEFKKLESLVKEQENATTITARVYHQGKMTNVQTDYYLREMLEQFDQIDASQNNAFIRWTLKNESRLPSIFLDEVGRRLYSSNPHEAFKYYYAGGVRAFYDIARCQDPGAGRVQYMIAMRNQDLRQYAQSNKEDAFKAAREGIAWVKERPYQASPLWACSHTVLAANFEGNQPKPVPIEKLIKPKSEWEGLRQEAYEQMAKALERKIKREGMSNN